MAELRPSGIRAVFDRALELEAAGRDIVHLEIGRPHVGSPDAAIRAATAALEAGDVHYTANRGRPELRSAIADRAGRDPDEVVVTSGGSEGVFAAVAAVLEPGDEAIVLDPAWPHYDGHVRMAGGVPIHVPCAAADGFQPDPDRVAAAITSRTRLLIVSSPSNPTGAVFEPERVAALAGLCERHDLVAVSDEIYASFSFDRPAPSIAAEPAIEGRVVIADSCSKTWSMTGWRVGWVIAAPALATRINAVHQHVGVCAPAFAQAGAVAALRDGGSHTAAMVAEYADRRADLVAGLVGPDVDLVPPGGAFYAFPAFARADAAIGLLEEAGVAVVPGAVFGEQFAGHLRISFAVSEAEFSEGLRRIRAWLEAP